MTNRVIHGMAVNQHVRVFGVDCRELVERSRLQHDLYPTSLAALGRVEAVACMMGAMLKNENEKIVIHINGGGPLGTVNVQIKGNGDVKGFVGDNTIYLKYTSNNKLAVGLAVGNNGTLTVTRDMGLKENFSGQVRLVSGEIGDDFAMYFNVSEQLPSAVSVGVLVDVDESCKAAGGLIFQMMPDATEEDIVKVENVVNTMRPISALLDEGKSIDEILMSCFDDCEILGEKQVQWHCDCSKDRFRAGISTLAAEDIVEMIEQDHGCEVKCEYCNTKYTFTEDELKSILEFKNSCLK